MNLTYQQLGVGLMLFAAVLHGANSNYCRVSSDVDIVVAIHDSANTMQYWWNGLIISQGVTNFLRKFISIFDYSRVRIALVAYGTTVRQIATYSNEPQTLTSAIDAWKPEFGQWRTYDAVSFVVDYIVSNARLNATKIAIFLTSAPSDDYMQTLAESRSLRSEQIVLIGVAFSAAPVTELTMMTGEIQQQVVYSSSSYALPLKVPKLKRLICLVVQLLTKLVPSTTATTTPAPFAQAPIIDIVLVMDHSFSTRRSDGLDITWASSITDFMTAYVTALTASNGRCAAGITTFSDTATTHLPITNDIVSQTATITSFITDDTAAFSGSRISLGLYQGMNELAINGQVGASKILLFIVDGSPDNEANMKATSQLAQASGFTIYVIGLDTLAGTAVTHAQLTALAGDVARTFPTRTDLNLAALAPTMAMLTCLNQLP